MKLSIPRSTIAAIVVGAVLIGLIISLGFIQGKAGTVTQDITEYQTQTVPVNQIITQTMTSTTTTSLSGSNFTFSNSTTILVPTTLDRTTTEFQTTTIFKNQTVLQTVDQSEASSSTAIITLASNYLIEFPGDQPELQILQASFTPGFDGYIQVSFQSNSTIHWLLAGNNENETSSSGLNGQVNFPVSAYIRYSLFVYNDECGFLAGCGAPFNATASILYVYEH